MQATDQKRILRLLNQQTQQCWCAIPTKHLQPQQAAVCVMPSNSPNTFTPSISYIPQKKPHHTNAEALWQLLNHNKKKILQVAPTFKYNLSGISIKVSQIIPVGASGALLIEGEIGLNGNLVVKPHNSLNPLTMTTHDFRKFSLSAKMAADHFVQSIKIKRCSAGGAPTFSLGTSLSDPVSMTATSVRISLTGPTTTSISASFRPTSPYKIRSQRLNCQLEVSMGYLFNGNITLLPATPAPASQHALSSTEKIMVSGGIVIGGILLTVFTGGADLLIAGGATAAIAATA